MTITQPRVMKAASLAIHLVSIHGPWGFQPSFHAIPVSYALLMPLCRLQDHWIHVFSHTKIRGWLYASLYLVPGSSPCPPHADSCHSYRYPPPCVPIDYPSPQPCIRESYK